MDATNEAYAFASCRDCTAVAVGFQVVLVLGQADVVVPQNLSAAGNYNCIECLTYALASQLVLTLDGPLSDAGMAKLETLWEEIAAYGRSLEDVPLNEIQARLNDYKTRILGIIEQDAELRESSADADTDAKTDTQPTSGQDTDGEPQPPGESTTVAPETGSSEPDSSADATAPAEPGSEPQPAPAPTTTSTPQPAPGSVQEPAPAPTPADEPAPAPTGAGTR